MLKHFLKCWCLCFKHLENRSACACACAWPIDKVLVLVLKHIFEVLAPSLVVSIVFDFPSPHMLFKNSNIFFNAQANRVFLSKLTRKAHSPFVLKHTTNYICNYANIFVYFTPREKYVSVKISSSARKSKLSLKKTKKKQQLTNKKQQQPSNN